MKPDYYRELLAVDEDRQQVVVDVGRQGQVSLPFQLKTKKKDSTIVYVFSIIEIIENLYKAWIYNINIQLIIQLSYQFITRQTLCMHKGEKPV